MPASRAVEALRERHRVIGWLLLFGYVLLGIVLEAMHGFKLGWYLDVSNATRREMWTLAHTHGTLLGVVHLCFAEGAGRMTLGPPSLAVASWSLVVAGLLMPLGFLLGGLLFYGGDPGLGILLVPVGAAGLLLGVGIALQGALRSARRPPDRSGRDGEERAG